MSRVAFDLGTETDQPNPAFSRGRPSAGGSGRFDMASRTGSLTGGIGDSPGMARVLLSIKAFSRPQRHPVDDPVA